ncbi:hypothetical protein SLEP1_g40453 [Rubroshorea leprosula]|uniref:Uncharacterized protein n=1 Tax=Rubroshorea leprosula TaxID=152421 RepID=A0AAV5L3R8_9ROSI|nr:hypothetical protein SLEP1_g40453 [Rubroshorea leprosula]
MENLTVPRWYSKQELLRLIGLPQAGSVPPIGTLLKKCPGFNQEDEGLRPKQTITGLRRIFQEHGLRPRCWDLPPMVELRG